MGRGHTAQPENQVYLRCKDPETELREVPSILNMHNGSVCLQGKTLELKQVLNMLWCHSLG